MTIPRIFFTYWEGDQLSKLHYYTILSLTKLNPNQKIIIYTSKEVSSVLVAWKSNEHNQKINKNIIKLSDIININPSLISLEAINFPKKYGINNNISVVYKADFIRVAKLYEHGGLWFDFDLLFISKIPDEYFTSDIDLYYFKISNVVPTGFLLTTPKNKIIKEIMDNQYEILKNGKKEYQYIGPTLWGAIFDKYEDLGNAECLDNPIVYPYAWNKIEKFFETNDEGYFKTNTIAIHWFNGAESAKKFINNMDKNMKKASMAGNILWQIDNFKDEITVKRVKWAIQDEDELNKLINSKKNKTKRMLERIRFLENMRKKALEE